MQNMFKYDDMEQFEPPQGKDGKDKYNRKMLLILVSYMMRLEESESVCLSKAKADILKLSPALIEVLLDAASEIQKAIQQGQIPPQKLSVLTLMSIIDFSQNMSQGIWDKDSAFLQLPGVKEDDLKSMHSKLKDVTFEQFCRKTADQRKKLNLYDEKKHMDIEKALKVFPLIDVKASAYVSKGDTKDPVVHAGDLLTIELDISSPLILKNQKRGYIHSTQFPFMRRDNFIVLITNADGSKILNYERAFFKSNQHTWKMVFRTGEPMALNLVAHVRNDAYKGLDYVKAIDVQVVPVDQTEGPGFQYSKKDLKEIAKKTILGQEVIVNPEDQDSDEELEDEFKGEAQHESEEED